MLAVSYSQNRITECHYATTKSYFTLLFIKLKASYAKRATVPKHRLVQFCQLTRHISALYMANILSDLHQTSSIESIKQLAQPRLKISTVSSTVCSPLHLSSRGISEFQKGNSHLKDVLQLYKQLWKWNKEKSLNDIFRNTMEKNASLQKINDQHKSLNKNMSVHWKYNQRTRRHEL